MQVAHFLDAEHRTWAAALLEHLCPNAQTHGQLCGQHAKLNSDNTPPTPQCESDDRLLHVQRVLVPQAALPSSGGGPGHTEQRAADSGPPPAQASDGSKEAVSLSDSASAAADDCDTPVERLWQAVLQLPEDLLVVLFDRQNVNLVPCLLATPPALQRTAFRLCGQLHSDTCRLGWNADHAQLAALCNARHVLPDIQWLRLDLTNAGGDASQLADCQEHAQRLRPTAAALKECTALQALTVDGVTDGGALTALLPSVQQLRSLVSLDLRSNAKEHLSQGAASALASTLQELSALTHVSLEPDVILPSVPPLLAALSALPKLQHLCMPDMRAHWAGESQSGLLAAEAEAAAVAPLRHLTKLVLVDTGVYLCQAVLPTASLSHSLRDLTLFAVRTLFAANVTDTLQTLAGGALTRVAFLESSFVCPASDAIELSAALVALPHLQVLDCTAGPAPFIREMLHMQHPELERCEVALMAMMIPPLAACTTLSTLTMAAWQSLPETAVTAAAAAERLSHLSALCLSLIHI